MECCKCGKSDTETKLYASFGKKICKECIAKRKKTNRAGNSGMVYNPLVKESDYVDLERKEIPLSLSLVPKSHPLYVKWFIEHYPESKGIVGRQINFLVYKQENPIGIIGFASPPLNYKKFNSFFGFNSDAHSENCKGFLNNNVYRLVHTEKNVGTQVLKIARKTIKILYELKYKEKLLGIVTFVEPPRDGALYKADNWIYLGETEGIEIKRRGEEWTQKQYTKGTKKLIYGYRY